MRVSSIFPNAAGTYSVFISGGYLRGKYTEHNALLECLRKECISLRSFGDYHFTVASLEDLLKVLKIFDEEGIDTEHIKSCINRNLLGLKDFVAERAPTKMIER